MRPAHRDHPFTRWPRACGLALLVAIMVSHPGKPTLAQGGSTPSSISEVAPAVSRIFTVNVDDDGPDLVPGDGLCNAGNNACTLRAAIQEANTTTDADEIHFNIQCVFFNGCVIPIIAPTSGLPAITRPLTIDGTTQPRGFGGVIVRAGLEITGGTSTVRGMRLGPAQVVVKLSSVGNNTIENNHLEGSGTASNLAEVVSIIDSSNNTITGNTIRKGFYGVRVLDFAAVAAATTNNRIQNNSIGNVGGDGADANEFGVSIEGATNTIVEGNTISGNLSHGVQILESRSTGNAVRSNKIGTNAAGTAALGNGGAGVLIQDAPSNTVGGFGARNIIAANNIGVLVRDGGGSAGNTLNTRVQGNYIGTDVTGSMDLGNVDTGVTIAGPARGVTVADNVISGNNGYGLRIAGAAIEAGGDNQVTGNYIGTDATGTVPLANGQGGVSIGGATTNNSVGPGNVISGNLSHGVNIARSGSFLRGNRIGSNAAGTGRVGNAGYGVSLSTGGVVIGGTVGTTPGGDCTGDCNLISYNGLGGVLLPTDGNQVLGNHIGGNVTLHQSGSLDGNVGAGVQVAGSNNVIGGASAVARNVISGNNGAGVQITNPGNQVLGNYIGVTANGATALPNREDGIQVYSANNVIGGSEAGAGNLISGNVRTGVLVDGGAVTGNRVEGNTIGLDAAGAGAIGNSNGVQVSGNAFNNLVGGTLAGARNVISGNRGNGVEIAGGATNNQVLGNYVGLNATGAAAVGNNFFGVRLNGVPNNTVGGAVTGARNVISGNSVGVRLSNLGATGNRIQGNFIGTDATGMVDLGNLNDGIFIDNAPNNTIGGATAAAGNVISGNDGHGIYILDLEAASNVVQSNLVGTQANGTGALSNGLHGVYIRNTTNIKIGGLANGTGNTIAFNAGDGVHIEPGATVTAGNAVLGNGIFANGGLGIDLFPDGVTPNDLGDGDPGANGLQNFPVLTAATRTGTTMVQGTLNSTANTTYTVQFFMSPSCDPAGHGEGQTFLTTSAVMTDATGHAPFMIDLGTTPALGQSITSTATDPFGNTSEFSACRSVAEPTPTATATATVTPTATPTATPSVMPTASATPTRTATPTPAPSPTNGLVGGRGLALQIGGAGGPAISAGGNGNGARAGGRGGGATSALLSWRTGVQQTGYLVIRWNAVSNQFAFLPQFDQFVPGNGTGFADPGPLPDATYCYVALIVGGSPPSTKLVLGISDLLCLYPGSGSGNNVPGGFTVKLNESNNVELNWNPVAGASGYEITASRFDASGPRTLTANPGALFFSEDTTGLTTCYQLRAIVGGVPQGSTDSLCAAPGVAVFTAGATGASGVGGALERIRTRLDHRGE